MLSEKSLIMPFFIIIFINLLFFPALALGMESSNYFMPLHANATTAEEAFTSITNSFEQMTRCFAPHGYINGYYFISAKNEQEIQARLTKAGFSSSLSERITSTYLSWDHHFQRSVLIPTDGIPIINREDHEQIEYFMMSENIIIFRRQFFDCYQPGDQYELFVTSIRDENNWVIYEWLLCS